MIMAAETLTVDIVDVSVPSMRAVNIAIINKPNPVVGYAVTYDELLYLLSFPQYYIKTSDGNPVTGENIYDYFPDEKPTPGPGPSPEPTPTGVSCGYAYPVPTHFFGIVVESTEHD